MRIKNITIQGFRGFNEERTIDFHERLTLIYAPNSYGKTSISEAFEWLLYGITSRVKNADSKEEYKRSYRNPHLPELLVPSVKVTFVDDDGNETEFHGDLAENEITQRFVNGQEVESWPLAQDISEIPKPFILQHALKYLLLAKPSERFQGFTRLLGLEKLDQIQRHIVSLCTKPSARIPNEVKQLLENVSALEVRLSSRPNLVTIEKAFKKGGAKAYEIVVSECRRQVLLYSEEEEHTDTADANSFPELITIPFVEKPIETFLVADAPEAADKTVFTELLRIRKDATDKVFKGRIIFPDYSEREKQCNTNDKDFFLNFATTTFTKKYTELVTSATVQHILNRVEFFDLGITLLDKAPNKCPFCGRLVDDALSEHIRDQHKDFATKKKSSERLQKQRTEVKASLLELKQRLGDYQTRHTSRSTQFLALESSLEQLKTILVPKHQAHFDIVESTISELAAVKQKLETSYSKVLEALKKVELSIAKPEEDVAFLKTLGEELAEYIADARDYALVISQKVSAVSDADQVLKHELDALAGTEDISILIDLIEQRHEIEKGLEIKSILNNLKNLNKSVGKYVADKVLQAISDELTAEVTEWYGQIKTTGDPDVHFGGFDIGRTKKGELKTRRVQIKATSYGKKLVSAVSSLSESKLNALGLCISIAINIKGESPFDFLIIDDPIQSWDTEHETQFKEVIRKLVERGKQVILMSHNRAWINTVRQGCRTINGCFYEITGYTEAGPYIAEKSWVEWKQQLNDIDAVIKSNTDDSARLRQAEEDIRIVVTKLASELYFKAKQVRKKHHNLNSKKVRKMLIECGINNNLVNHITQTFGTTDDAHHDPKNYTAHRERLRNYYAWVCELANAVEKYK